MGQKTSAQTFHYLKAAIRSNAEQRNVKPEDTDLINTNFTADCYEQNAEANLQVTKTSICVILNVTAVYSSQCLASTLIYSPCHEVGIIPHTVSLNQQERGCVTSNDHNF